MNILMRKTTEIEKSREPSLENLKIKPSLFWLFKQGILYWLRKIFYIMPFVGKSVRFIGHRLLLLGKLDGEEKQRLDSIKLLKEDQEGAQKFHSLYGYSDAIQEIIVAGDYRQQILNPNFISSCSESAILYDHIVTTLLELFRKDTSITELLNFGVSYAHVDSILAKLNPRIHFTGIDRSIFTKLYNEEYFSHINNLKFITGDIFETLEKRKFSNAVLFHTRTLCLLPPSFILHLYKKAAAAGFQYIVGMEQMGISRSTYKEFNFSYEPSPSVIFRNGMFIHNYPGILKESGFRVVDIELIETRHLHRDYRVLSFIAKREAESKV